MDRRHCNLKWQSRVQAIREKINAAIQDMPENQEIKQLLDGACECGLGLGGGPLTGTPVTASLPPSQTCTTSIA